MTTVTVMYVNKTSGLSEHPTAVICYLNQVFENAIKYQPYHWSVLQHKLDTLIPL